MILRLARYFVPILIMLAAAAHLRSEEIHRHILALYDSGRGQSQTRNPIHQNAEFVLNHLGCIVDYWDLADDLPKADKMQNYRGVLTWFYSDAMRRPEQYLTWAEAQVRTGRQFVILGNLGAFRDAESGEFLPIKRVNKFLRTLGFVADNRHWTNDISRTELVSKTPIMVEFERTLDYELDNFEIYRLVDESCRPYLILQRNDVAASRSAMVLTSPAGGFAAAGYVIYENDETNRRRWRLNPFRFFEEAFGLAQLPRPDVTTRNGLRIWMSHIDGDAFISGSHFRRNAYCGEVIRDEILRKFQLPVSVSVVTSEVNQGPEFEDIARSIFALDWIEPASHSYSHPFYWDENSEDKGDYELRHLPIPGYEFDVRTEIAGSVAFINKNLLPPNKKVKTFFWTGNCVPTAEALRQCRQANLLNINGGDTMFDRRSPSYTNVAPLSARVGNELQIYAAGANENIYTNNWSGPYYGYTDVLRTCTNTESPMRVKPIDVYYHFYSGERLASLNALKQILEETTREPVAPVFISEYLAIVQGFLNATLEQIESGWRLSNYAECRTFRFDNTNLYPDLDRSRNVIGYLNFQGALYVHLGDASEARLILTDDQPQNVYLSRASHVVKSWSTQRNKISFATEGYGPATFEIANLDSDHSVDIRISMGNIKMQKVRTNKDGLLSFSCQMNGAANISIAMVN